MYGPLATAQRLFPVEGWDQHVVDDVGDEVIVHGGTDNEDSVEPHRADPLLLHEVAGAMWFHRVLVVGAPTSRRPPRAAGGGRCPARARRGPPPARRWSGSRRTCSRA